MCWWAIWLFEWHRKENSAILMRLVANRERGAAQLTSNRNINLSHIIVIVVSIWVLGGHFHLIDFEYYGWPFEVKNETTKSITNVRSHVMNWKFNCWAVSSFRVSRLICMLLVTYAWVFCVECRERRNRTKENVIYMLYIYIYVWVVGGNENTTMI